MSWWEHPSIAVGIGGAVGSNLRYWLGRWVRDLSGGAEFPWGTLIINVTGSITLAVIASLVRDRTSAIYLLFGIGFCGGYTTFSTFSLEMVEALNRGRWDTALLYAATSVGAGFVGFLLVFAMLRSETT